MLSQTAQYALRAVVAIARADGKRMVLAREIANQSHIPCKYLSKVLGDLVRAGIVSSSRGINGGFRMRRQANKIKLIDILKLFDDVSTYSRCPLCLHKCSDDTPCALHEKWQTLKEAVQTLLENTTVGDLVEK